MYQYIAEIIKLLSLFIFLSRGFFILFFIYLFFFVVVNFDASLVSRREKEKIFQQIVVAVLWQIVTPICDD